MIHHLLESRITEKAHASKWETAIKRTALLLSILSVLLLTLGLMAYYGIIQSTSAFLLLAACICVAIGLTWLISVMLVVERRLDRQALAAAVEHDNDVLQDRLNTVVELDQRVQRDTSAAMYRDAIEEQAARLVPNLQPARPLRKRSVTIHLLVMLLLGLLAINFYVSTSPLQTLAANEAQEQFQEDDIQPLVIPDDPITATTEPEEQPDGTWGEIRISEPGRDLRITIHEDVPLLIEAASDRPLANITWQTQVNESEEVTRPLPKLEDPRYAVFQPILHPKQLGLEEWDVTRYHAIANAIDETQYGSASYFVEIVPDAEALRELPGAGYESLEELTDLIHRQQQVIRSTEKLTDAEDSEQQKTMDSLAERESALSAAGRSVQQDLSGRLDQETLRKFASSLEAASTAFTNSETELLARDPGKAEQSEETALMHLVAARRELAKLIEQNPGSFADSALEELEDQPTLSATEADPELAKLVQRLAEESQQVNDASREMSDLLELQEKLADEANTLEEGPLQAFRSSELSKSQQNIGSQFNSLREQFPKAFQDLQGLAEKTAESMSRSSDQLMENSKMAGDSAEQAKNNLQNLHEKIEQRRNDYEQFQAKSLQQRIAENREAYQSISKSGEQENKAKISEAVDETHQLLREIPDNIESTKNPSENTASSNKPQLNETDNPEDKAEKETTHDSQAGSFAKVKDQIKQQTQTLQSASDSQQQSATAKNLDKSLARIAEALKQEAEKRQQSLNQKQMASELRQLQEKNQAMQNARDFVKDAINREESIQSRAAENLSTKDQFQKLARDQLLLEQDMKMEREQNPAGFEAVTGQCDKVQKEMQQTTRALNAGQENAPITSKQAVDSLEQLDQSLAKQQTQIESAQQAEIAKQMEKLINQLGEMEKKPDDFSTAEKQQTAGQCQSVGSMACKNPGNSGSGGQTSGSGTTPPPTTSQPEQTPPTPGGSQTAGTGSPSSSGAEPSSTGPSPESGQPAKAGSSSTAESPGNSQTPEQALKDATERLADASGTRETSEAAGGLKQQMQNLAEGMGLQLGAGQPSARQGNKTAGQGDALSPSGSESLARGLAQLESAARQGEQGNLTPQASRALRENGLSDITTGLQSQYGYNDGTQILIQRVKQEVEGPKLNIDLKTVNELRAQIQKAQRDFVMKPDTPQAPESTLRNDPAKYPSAYRESIQNYFEALSEDKSQ